MTCKTGGGGKCQQYSQDDGRYGSDGSGRTRQEQDPCARIPDGYQRELCRKEEAERSWREQDRQRRQEEERAYRAAEARCPSSPPRGHPDWKPYVGYPQVFHCGYEGYLEKHPPSPRTPIAECFYDERGRLVDSNHPYAGCRGTPDEYGAHDARHVFIDRGGVAKEGLGALKESLWRKASRWTK